MTTTVGLCSRYAQVSAGSVQALASLLPLADRLHIESRLTCIVNPMAGAAYPLVVAGMGKDPIASLTTADRLGRIGETGNEKEICSGNSGRACVERSVWQFSRL